MSWRVVVIENQAKLDYKMGVSGGTWLGYKAYLAR